jgi:hypothetical protein
MINLENYGNDDFIASFEDYVEHEGLYYEIHYSVI